MKRSNLEIILQDWVTQFKRFVTSRDLFIFLVFLILSSSLWVLHALKKNYETALDVPVIYKNLPNGYIITNELEKKVHATMTGQGINLISYRIRNSFEPLVIDLSEIENGKRYLPTQTLIGALQKQIKTETKILRLKPDTIFFSVEKQTSKVIPVKIDGCFELAQQYTYCDSIEIEPKSVIAYGPQQVISELMLATSREVKLTDIQDTLTTTVKLQSIPNVTFSDSIIYLKIRTERYTEKSIQTPISVANLPKNRVLRIFPSNVEVSFRVGLSNYDKIDASSFSLSVDYEETNREETKLKIQVKKAPSEAFNIKTAPEYVDYIIEEKRVQ